MINVSEVLAEFAQPVIKKIVVNSTVDFQPVVSVKLFDIDAVVQPADPAKLTAITLDWSLKHFRIDTTDMLQLGNVIEYKGADYKIVWLSDFDDYGYTMGIMEETKRPVLQETLQ